MAANLDSAFAAVASTSFDDVDLELPQCHGPLIEDEIISSPMLRLKEVVEHADMTPDLLAAAERVAGMEVKARQNARIGDALFAQEAKGVMSEIKSTLFERKKKRVHEAGAGAVAAIEAKVLAKQARKAAKDMKRALGPAVAIKPRTRNNLGHLV